MRETSEEHSDTHWPEIIGHKSFERSFVEAQHRDRLHHAWLLTGPKGIGKAALALRATAWLMAEDAASGGYGGVETGFTVASGDSGAKLVRNGAHPDLNVVAPLKEDNKSGQIKIDQIRSLIPFMMHKPGRAGWRVAIIDSMDEVNRNGANALLKMLEEPPERTVLFLLSSRPGRLPPTIRSRCRVARLSPLSRDESDDVLRQIWPDADAEQLKILSILSEGAPGRALMLAESGAADCYQAACALLSEDRLDRAALVTICGKWGKGGAAGKDTRLGATMLIERLLRLSALRVAGASIPDVCGFEDRVIDAMSRRHTGQKLAEMQNDFSREAAQADSLYLDFALFLSRQLTRFHQKSLP